MIPEAPKHPATVILKSALDQLLMAPFGTVVFYAFLKSMESEPHMTVPTVREKLIPTLKENYKFWPLAHIINFAIVPPSLRILYVNCISVSTNCVWVPALKQKVIASVFRASNRFRMQSVNFCGLSLKMIANSIWMQ